MYWSFLSRLATRYSAMIFFPVSVVIGFIGYKVESLISDKSTPSLPSVKEKREERLLNEGKEEVDSIKKHSFVPKTIFEKNLSQSLKDPDPERKKS